MTSVPDKWFSIFSYQFKLLLLQPPRYTQGEGKGHRREGNKDQSRTGCSGSREEAAATGHQLGNRGGQGAPRARDATAAEVRRTQGRRLR